MDGSKDTTSSADVNDPTTWLADHGDCLFAYAMSRVNDVDLAEDLVQETLLGAIGRPGSFQARSSLRTWLVGILKHKLLDHYRRVGKRDRAACGSVSQSSENDLDELMNRQFTGLGKWKTPPGPWGSDPNHLPEETEFKAVLADCLDKLPPRAQEAVFLVERQELSSENVGKVLGISTTNVGVLLHRARTALRHCLESNWFNPFKGK